MTGLTRDRQLELVARNIGDWPDFYDVCYWSTIKQDVSFAHEVTLGESFTRSEVETKQREITGEPDDKEAPEWAKSKAQDACGEWHWYMESNPEHDDIEWLSIERYEDASEGEVLGDWRDTLKPVSVKALHDDPSYPSVYRAVNCRCSTVDVSSPVDVSAVNGEQIGDDMNKSELVWGEKYVYRPTGSKWIFVGIDPGHKDYGVFAPEDDRDIECLLLSAMIPSPSERDEFIEAAKSLDCHPQEGMLSRHDFCGAIFDAIKEGRLPAPEVKK